MTMMTCAGGRPFPSVRVLLRLVVAAVALSAGVAAVPAAKPEDIGLSSERLQRIGQLIERYIADRQITGAVTVVTRKGRIAHGGTARWPASKSSGASSRSRPG